MTHYLVTGGCGFIGSHLSDALIAAGHTVRIIDDLSSGKIENKPKAAELVIGDVADTASLARAMKGVDACFHLAAIASVELGNINWLQTHRTNLTGSIAVFDAARRARPNGTIPVVYASSAAVYGDSLDIPISEESCKRPLSSYGADKLGSEQHGFIAGRVHGVPTCGLRFFNVYGPRQDPASPYSGVISIFCDRLRAGRPITIFGNGEQTRDFVFVTDVVRALIAAMERASVEGKVYNVCTGRGTSIIDLARIIAEIIGVTGQHNFGPPRAGEVRHSLGDPAKAHKELDFLAQVELRVGLEATLEESKIYRQLRAG